MKHRCANRFSKTIIAILLNLLHICPSMPLLYAVLFIPFIVLSSYFHVSLSLVACSSQVLNQFDKFRDTDPLYRLKKLLQNVESSSTFC